MKTRILLLLVLFQAFVFAVPLQAQQGLLLLEKGSVKVIGPDRTRLLRKPGTKLVLRAKDRVQTGKDTSVKIKIRGKPEIIELSSRAFFRMGKITRQTSSISLLTGKARFKIQGKLKKKSKRKRFQIRTVTALVGVRGTDFVVGASNTQTSLLTISGTVSVAPVSMPDIEIEVPENQASTVQQDSTPTTPVEVAPKMREQIVKADSPKAFKIVKFGEAVNPEEVRKENKKKKKEEEEEQKKEKEKQKKEEEKQKKEKPKKDGEGKDGEGKPRQEKEGEPKPGEDDPEGEGKPGDEKGPRPEGEEGLEQEGEEGSGKKGPRGPGMPGKGDEGEEGPGGPGGPGEPQFGDPGDEGGPGEPQFGGPGDEGGPGEPKFDGPGGPGEPKFDGPGGPIGPGESPIGDPFDLEPPGDSGGWVDDDPIFLPSKEPFGGGPIQYGPETEVTFDTGPGVPVDPFNPGLGDSGGGPVDPFDPNSNEPGKLGDPERPGKPGDPEGPGKPGDPEGPEGPGKPDDPKGPGNPSDSPPDGPVDPGKPGDPPLGGPVGPGNPPIGGPIDPVNPPIGGPIDPVTPPIGGPEITGPVVPILPPVMPPVIIIPDLDGIIPDVGGILDAIDNIRDKTRKVDFEIRTGCGDPESEPEGFVICYK